MNYMTTVVFLVDEYGVSAGEAMWLSSDLLFTGEGLALVITSSGSMFLFMVLGLFIAWSFIVKTNAGSAKQLDAMGSTLRPNPAYSPDSYGQSYQTWESGAE